MSDDPRCCGTGTCIINAEGLCWCGQRWDGEKMCFMPEPAPQTQPAHRLGSPPHPMRTPEPEFLASVPVV
ncbi:hypothetical protein ACHEXL_02820 [Limnohabitans sp. yimb22184]|uniref:hypothetical protein n=1 Tax=Limnohabitans sp. YIMB22184 TaxID=3374104 RepID=UPI003A842E5E